MEANSDNWLANTADGTSAKTQRRLITFDDDEIRIEQNLIDTYASVVTIKKHGVVIL